MTRRGGKGERREMRNARLLVQNCLFRPKVEVYIQALLHNMTKLEAGKVDGLRLNLINDIGHARHKPVI